MARRGRRNEDRRGADNRNMAGLTRLMKTRCAEKSSAGKPGEATLTQRQEDKGAPRTTGEITKQKNTISESVTEVQ